MQSRGGKGIKAMNLTAKVGQLAGQLLVHDDEDILLITDDGTIIRMPVADISVLGRNTQGVRLMRVEEGCRVVCVARAEAEEDAEEESSDEAGQESETNAPESDNPSDEI